MLRLRGDKVREMIAATGLSVRAWGIEHGFPQGTLSNWLQGTRNIKKSMLVRLAEALHCDVTEISMIVVPIDQEKMSRRDEQLDELRYLWTFLTDAQRQQVLALLRSIAEPKIKESE